MSTSSTYQTCLVELGGGGDNSPTTEALLECISTKFDDTTDSTHAAVDTFFLLFAASLVFFMQAGFAMLSAGCVRTNNVQNTLLKNLLDACGASLGFYTVGYAFAWGGSTDPYTTTTTFIGNQNFFLIGVENDSFWLFQFAFCATSATIVAGALAERCQMTAYLCYSIALSAFVYPVVVHSIWTPSGFLSATKQVDPLWGVGMVDFAGSSVVHLTGGMTALIATIILGPRTGRFYDLRGKPLAVPKDFPGHSLALQMLGVSVLFFWIFGFRFVHLFSLSKCSHRLILFIWPSLSIISILRSNLPPGLHLVVWLVRFQHGIHHILNPQRELQHCQPYRHLHHSCGGGRSSHDSLCPHHRRRTFDRRNQIQLAICHEWLLKWIGFHHSRMFRGRVMGIHCNWFSGWCLVPWMH